jgi:hypothetical protein
VQGENVAKAPNMKKAVPRDNGRSTQEYTTLLADTSITIGRSLAAGDINIALLVK